MIVIVLTNEEVTCGELGLGLLEHCSVYRHSSNENLRDTSVAIRANSNEYGRFYGGGDPRPEARYWQCTVVDGRRRPPKSAARN